MAKKKSNFLKKLVLSAGALLLLAFVAFAMAIHFIDWNALKDKGAAYLSKTLHHKVSIGSIEAGLFSGIKLGKLSIANAPGYGSQPLFYNEEAKVRLSILSIFTGKLVISEIEFKNPKVFVVKDARGRFNFSDMSASAPAGAAAGQASGGSSSAPNVVIASFRLSGGDLSYKDLGKGTTQAVKGLDILLSGLSLRAGGNSRLEIKFTAETEGKKIPVDLSANFSVDQDKQVFKILSAELKAPSLDAKLDAQVDHLKDKPQIHLNVHAQMAGSPVTLKLDASGSSMDNLTGPSDKLRLMLRYELSSPKLMLDPLLALSGGDDSASASGGAAAKPAPNRGIVDYRKTVSKDLEVEGDIHVDAMQLKQIQMGKFDYKVLLKNRKFQANAKLELFQGEFQAVTTADLNVPGPSFAFQSTLSKMQFQPFVDEAAASFPEKKSLAQLKGKVTGSLSFQASGKGRGFSPPASISNMDMKGQFQMLDGKISKLDMQEKLAAAIPHPATAAALRKDLSFGQMLGDFAMKNSIVKLNSFEMSSGADHRQGDILIQANGQMKVGGAVDFHVAPHFNPRVVKLDGTLQEAFADEQGWASYNSISYSGPTFDTAKADFKAGAAHAAKQVAQKEATKFIQNNGQGLIKKLPGGLQNLFGK